MRLVDIHLNATMFHLIHGTLTTKLARTREQLVGSGVKEECYINMRLDIAHPMKMILTTKMRCLRRSCEGLLTTQRRVGGGDVCVAT